MANITIIMPTYNKEKYIAKALDSVFMQKTDYDYQIIVADDCSSDRTLEIIKEYQEKFPNKITLLTSDKNLKLYKNIVRAYELTKTDYFSVLDPDDYWIDEYNIQKALDFLEANQNYTIYATNIEVLDINGNRSLYLKQSNVQDSDFKDFLKNKATLSCTQGSIYRNVVFKNGLPEKMKTLECKTQEQSFRGDSFRNAIHLHEGKAHYVPEISSVYRITDEGLWQGIDSCSRDLINANIFKDLWLYFDKKYDSLLFSSYKTFHRIKVAPNLFQAIAENKNNVLAQLSDLEKTYEENSAIIEKAKRENSITLKNRVLLFIYKILFKKLSKKGLI